MGTPLRSLFAARLQSLQDEVLLLGSMVEKALVASVAGFLERDLDQSKSLLVQVDAVRRRRAELEKDTLTLMVTQHPVAGDLRLLAAGLEIVAELGRMGGYLEEINTTSLLLGPNSLPRQTYVARMAQEVQAMLHQALSAFVERNLALAQTVLMQDNQVDRLYEQANQALAGLRNNEHDWDQCLHLLRVAHRLERMGDRVTNICEWVIYAITGELVEMN